MDIFDMGSSSASGILKVPAACEGLELEGMLWHEEHSGIAKRQIMLRAKRPGHAGYIS